MNFECLTAANIRIIPEMAKEFEENNFFYSKSAPKCCSFKVLGGRYLTRFSHISVDILFAQKEFVHECLHLRILAQWQLAMGMTTFDGVAHAVGNAKGVPHFTRCFRRLVVRVFGKPFIISVTQYKQCTRSYQCSKFVMVDGQGVFHW